MIVSHTWLAEHIHGPNIVILDFCGNVGYSYAHIPNSQPFGIEKVVKINQHDANLVVDEDQASKLFGSLGIDETKTLVVYGDYMDPSAAKNRWI